MSYAPDEDRLVVCRLAIFTHTVGRLEDEPTGSGTLLHPYHCLIFDLCKQNGVPRFDWKQPGRNGLSVISMRTENMDVQFRDDDPCVVQVRKREVETSRRSEILGALVDIDGLIMVQDVGITGEEDYEDQMIAICALVAEAKKLFDPEENMAAKDFHVPSAVIAATLGGRVSNRNRETVEDLAETAGWPFGYVSTLHNELEVGAMVVKLTAKIHKRGLTSYRLVPGLLRPSPKSPLPIPIRRPVLEDTPRQVNERVEELSPGDSPSIVTPYIERFPMPGGSTAPPLPISTSTGSGLIAGTSSGSILGMTASTSTGSIAGIEATGSVTAKKSKKSRLPTPIPQASRPTLTSTRSGGSLSTSTSSRSLRAAPLAPPITEEAAPPVPALPPLQMHAASPAKAPLFSPVPAEPPKVDSPRTSATQAEQRLNIQISAPLPSIDRAAVLAATLARTRLAPESPVDPMDDTVPEPYIPYISDVTEEGSFYNRYRQPRPAPAPPPATTRGVEPWFDMEGPNVPTGSGEGTASKKGFFGKWGWSKSTKKSQINRPALRENTFLTPVSPGPARPPTVNTGVRASESRQVMITAPVEVADSTQGEPADSTLASSTEMPTPLSSSQLTSLTPSSSLFRPPAPAAAATQNSPQSLAWSPTSMLTSAGGSPRRGSGRAADLSRDQAYELQYGVRRESDDRVFTGATFERMEREKTKGCCVIA